MEKRLSARETAEREGPRRALNNVEENGVEKKGLNSDSILDWALLALCLRVRETIHSSFVTKPRSLRNGGDEGSI